MKLRLLSNTKRTTTFVFVLLAIMTSTSLLSLQASGIAPPEIIEPPVTTHTFKVYGYTKDSGGNPISGVTVRLTYGDLETGIYVTDITDSNGYYYISVTTRLYVTATLKAIKSGYNTVTSYVYTSGVIRKDFTMTIAAHYFRVYGYVKSEIGTPIQGVITKLQYGGTTYKTDVTDSNGYYSMAITTTLYKYFTVTAEKSGYDPESKSVYSTSTRRADFTLYATDGDKFYDIVPKFTKVNSMTGGPITDSEPINLIWQDSTAAEIRSFFTSNGWDAMNGESVNFEIEWLLFIPVAILVRIDATNTVGAYDGSSVVNNYQGEAYVKNSEYYTFLTIGFFKFQLPIKRDHFRIWEIEDSNEDTIVMGSGTYDDGLLDDMTSGLISFLNDPLVSTVLLALSIAVPEIAIAQLLVFVPGILSLMAGYGNLGHLISSTTPWRTAEQVRNTWTGQGGSYSYLDRLSVSKTWSLTSRSLTWTGTAYEMF